MVKGALIDTDKQGRLDSIFRRILDKLSKCTLFVDTLMHQLVGCRSIIRPIAVFVETGWQDCREHLFWEIFWTYAYRRKMAKISYHFLSSMSPGSRAYYTYITITVCIKLIGWGKRKSLKRSEWVDRRISSIHWTLLFLKGSELTEKEVGHIPAGDHMEISREIRWTTSRFHSSANSSHPKEDELEVFCSDIDQFKVTMDLHRYGLPERYTHNDGQNCKALTKWACRCQVQLQMKLT